MRDTKYLSHYRSTNVHVYTLPYVRSLDGQYLTELIYTERTLLPFSFLLAVIPFPIEGMSGYV